MTKRILAAFLAVMMVVGILPVSVFAANECAVLTQYTDHSKEHCVKAGVGYTMVPNSTVNPACGQDGYTLYQCACGEYFADDIIPMDPHHTESGEPKTARREPTCYRTGKIAVYVCDFCGKDYFDPADLAAPNVDKDGKIEKLPHTFDQIDYSANDCTKTEQYCENEGCFVKNTNHKPMAEHNWNYDDPFAIVKAPTEHEMGEAEFKCANEFCAQTKKVEVHMLDHKNTMTFVEAVAPDCKNKGNIEHWHCDVCNKNYVEVAGELVEEENVVLDEVHAWNTDPIIIPATCETWGFSYYGCPLCGATKGVTPETEKDDMTKYKPLGHTPFACATHTETADPDCADCTSYGQSITDPTCELDGSYDWFCGRCDKAMTTPITKTGHAKVKVVVPATHKFAYTYTYTICTNEYCDRTGVKEFTYADGDFKDIAFDVTVEVRKDGNVYDMPADATVHLLDAPTSIAKKTTGFVHFFVEDKTVQLPNCTDEGKAFWYCAGENGCNTYFDEVLKPLGHDYSDKTNDIDPTCTTNAFKVCDRVGCTDPETGAAYQNEQKGTALGHKLVKINTVLPLCDETKGYSTYECSVCGHTEDKDSTSFVKNKTYLGVAEIVLAGVKTKLTAKEEFEMEHPGFSGTYEEYRAGDCLNNGYWKAYCADCDKTYLVLIDDTGKGHKVPAGTEFHEKADCLNAQGYVDYICERCGEPVKNTNKPLGHAMTKHAAVAPNCTEGGNLEYYTCANECCKDILFKDVDGAATYAKDEQLVPALGHDYADTTVEVNCVTPGFTHHICSRCADEYVDGYVAPTGHTRGANVSVTARCITDGCISYKCSNAGCTGDDGIAGTADDGIESYQVIPATGHKNAKGQIITNICTDTVTDRVCVTCNNITACNGNNACKGDVVKNAKGKWEVKKDHAPEEAIVDAGCEHYGYKMETCANGCGELDKVTELVAPYGHLAPWGQRILNEDMTPVDEDDARYYGEEFLETDPEVYNGYITAYTAPTYETLGSVSFKCAAHCGDEITRDVIRVGVDFTIEMDNAAVSGANDIVDEDGVVIDFVPVDGDVIAVDIYANAYKTDVWGFNFDVDYSAYALNFMGYKYEAAEIFGNYKVNNILSDFEYTADVNGDGMLEQVFVAENYNGKIKVSAFTENSFDGKAYDAPINGTVKIMTLYFQIEAQFNYTELGIAKTDFDHVITVSINDSAVVNAKGEVESAGDYFATEATDMLDVNKNGVLNITDLYMCNQILTGEADYEYLASADANKDGKITITDLDLMNQLLQGADESSIYNKLNWTAPEGFVAA